MKLLKRSVANRYLLLLALAGCAVQFDCVLAADPAKTPADAPAHSSSPDNWPRTISLNAATALVYQPQVEQWKDNQLNFRAAVGVKPGGARQETYGVIWGQARTQVDRTAQLVTLEDIRINCVNFPTLPDSGASYQQQLQQHYSSTDSTIALARLQASLASSETVNAKPAKVRNNPPRIIVSESPAVLVPIAGQPVIKDVPDSSFERIINTRALIIRPRHEDTWYLHLYDGWMSASNIVGPWQVTNDTPGGIGEVADKLAKSGETDLLDGGSTQPKPMLAKSAPTVYVSETATELLVFKGEPDFQPIGDTALLWAANTTADVLVDTSDNSYYVLLSGRWFRSATLNSGSWEYVASDRLPDDFRHIPAGSPAAVVLTSVAGTPQAKEALIADSIPQTATIPRSGGPEFKPTIDGEPQWRDMEGTSLKRIVNSEVPVIEVPDGSLYALSAGVWFTSNSLDGPWAVATKVPDTIYTIPASSALYYVTFAHVYGYNDQDVYVGYTPGYLGTVVEPDGTVVYGTGYDYTPWVGSYYYAAPDTYGIQAQPVYNPYAGTAYAFALGLTTAAMVDSWHGGDVYYGGYYRGLPCCGSTSANVYGRYGATSFSGSRTWYDKSSGEIGVKSSGSYINYRTGATGTYSTNRYENPQKGTAGRSYDRSFSTVQGTTGDVNRSETYDAKTGEASYSGSMSATGARGGSVSRESSASWGAQGPSSTHETTVTNAAGESKTVGSGWDSGDHYASANGESYRNDGSGWQKQTDSGWQSVSGEDTSWADKEQQARSQGQQRVNSFGGDGAEGSYAGGGTDNFSSREGNFENTGFGDRSGGGIGDGTGAREGGFNGGGFGGSGNGSDRAGGFGGGDFSGGARDGQIGGGFGGRFAGGGFGGRFGGGGFGGFRGRR